MKKLILALLLTFSTSVFADGYECEDDQYPCCNDGNCDICFGMDMEQYYD